MSGLSWKQHALSIGARLARRTLAGLLPQDCFLCGEAQAVSLLCAACSLSLPRMPSRLCRVCALPSPFDSICGPCLGHPPHYDASVAALCYGFPVDRLIQALKFQHRLAVADYLAGVMLGETSATGDALLPVPLSAARLRQRGFNQAVEIARPLARRTGLPLLLDACVRNSDTAAQAALPWKERHRNVRHAFECRVDLSGMHIILIDDVMTTGATLNELARTLKNHGAARVENWVVARTLKE